MSNDLEAILTGEDVAEPVQEAAEAAPEATEVEAPAETEEAPQAAGKQRDEHGRFVKTETEEPTGEKPAEQAADASPAPEEPEVSSDDRVAGMAAELARIRAKNRELEERMTQQAEAQPEPPAPDFFEDPDRALQTMEQRMEQKLNRARIEWSEQSARQRYKDFDDKVSTFTDLANENPMLWQQMSQSADPADFAYKQATQFTKMRQFEDIDKFEEKIRAEERLKVEKEQAARYEAKLKELSELPGSLSDTRAAGGNNTPPVTDESLDDIAGVDVRSRQ